MSENSPTIYIVEDEPLLHERILYYLKARGFKIVGSSISGDRAVKDILIGGIIPDVIVLDANLPMLDSTSFGKVIKSRYPHVKFIYLVSDDRDERKLAEVRKLGGIALKRPFPLSDMMSAIRSLTQT